MLDAALDMYRSRYRPSTQSERPYVLVGVNIVAAPSDDEARFLATSQQMSFADFLRSEPRLLQPPVDDIDSYWSPQEKRSEEHTSELQSLMRISYAVFCLKKKNNNNHKKNTK